MSAIPLSPGLWQFCDNDGVPLNAGTVTHYYPGGTTPKDTWTDYAQQVTNSNPLTLDSAGRAAIWGQGRYRQILKDSLGNTIWDKETAVSFVPLAAPFEFLGNTPPTTLETMGMQTFDQAVTFPANFSGIVGFCRTAPTATFTATAKNQSGTTLGTFSVSTGKVFTATTTGGAVVNMAAGDTMIWIGPSSVDATIADISWTLPYSLT